MGGLVAPDVVTHNPIILDAPTGPDSIRGGLEMLHKAFPDFRVEIEDLIAEGDRVAAFLTMSGTNEGVADRFGFLQELGIFPSDDELAARMPRLGTRADRQPEA